MHCCCACSLPFLPSRISYQQRLNTFWAAFALTSAIQAAVGLGLLPVTPTFTVLGSSHPPMILRPVLYAVMTRVSGDHWAVLYGGFVVHAHSSIARRTQMAFPP